MLILASSLNGIELHKTDNANSDLRPPRRSTKSHRRDSASDVAAAR